MNLTLDDLRQAAMRAGLPELAARLAPQITEETQQNRTEHAHQPGTMNTQTSAPGDAPTPPEPANPAERTDMDERTAVVAADRFWGRVNKTEGCWEWRGPLHKLGYGLVGHANLKAHRVAWELTNGPVPEGLLVRHMCHNPPCVRPDHLKLGTQKDNMADMYAAGRGRKATGTDNGNGKLTDEQVAEIRSRYVFRKVTHRMLAAEYGVSESLVEAICNGRARKNIVSAFVAGG